MYRKVESQDFNLFHKSSDYEWANHCYKVLSQFIPLNVPKYKKVIDKRVKVGYTESYYVQSKTCDYVTLLESIWYKNRKRVIPFEFVKDYLDVKALAWWYQDDGHLKLEKNIPRKIILSTDSFTKEENEFLIKELNRKYLLSFSRDSQNRLVIYDQRQIYYFIRLTQPYMHKSMVRKSFPIPHKNTPNQAYRTTIYLPETIKLTKPTYQINKQLENLSDILDIVKVRESYLNFYKNKLLVLNEITIRKSYQVIIDKSHREKMVECKNYTGLNNSDIVTICFIMNSNTL
ncbi:hypothetical protein [Bacillus andreraoultii]|uniref:hypothetical protein n=1 Tax=Bacillus andreraoultii TaxID=1499685 RepID=UPI0009E1C943|nr:hypothetical protein [Bacillus andreraoultii]